MVDDPIFHRHPSNILPAPQLIPQSLIPFYLLYHFNKPSFHLSKLAIFCMMMTTILNKWNEGQWKKKQKLWRTRKTEREDKEKSLLHGTSFSLHLSHNLFFRMFLVNNYELVILHVINMIATSSCDTIALSLPCTFEITFTIYPLCLQIASAFNHHHHYYFYHFFCTFFLFKIFFRKVQNWGETFEIDRQVQWNVN